MTQTEKPFTIAAVQAAPVFLDRDRTIDKACDLIRQAAKKGAKIIVFPEAFVPTYPDWVWVLPPASNDLHRQLYGELLDQSVAIKFLLDDLATSEEGAERFRREARAAAKIQSDHVVRVLDVGVLPTGERYMVMEYMEGRDLAEELAEKGTLPVGIATGIILEAIDAVGHAHSVGIVHRDLKPANLFLADRPDGSRRVKVLDFGISKSIGSTTAEELSLTKTSA